MFSDIVIGCFSVYKITLEVIIKRFDWGRQCFRAMRANTGARYVTARRAMDIARAKVARTTPTVGKCVVSAHKILRRGCVPNVVRAAFARAMCIARRAVT